MVSLAVCVLTPHSPFWTTAFLSSLPSAVWSICVVVLAPKFPGCNPPSMTQPTWCVSAEQRLPDLALACGMKLLLAPGRCGHKGRTQQGHKNSSVSGCWHDFSPNCTQSSAEWTQTLAFMLFTWLLRWVSLALNRAIKCWVGCRLEDKMPRVYSICIWLYCHSCIFVNSYSTDISTFEALEPFVLNVLGYTFRN